MSIPCADCPLLAACSNCFDFICPSSVDEAYAKYPGLCDRLDFFDDDLPPFSCVDDEPFDVITLGDLSAD